MERTKVMQTLGFPVKHNETENSATISNNKKNEG